MPHLSEPAAPSTGVEPLAEHIDRLLPQTQCRQCGFEGCHPYAQALANGTTEIDRCPPGGLPVMRRLARLLGRAERALDNSRGEHRSRQVAAIDEELCIGCTLCIQACPVDAIAGAPKLMHTVISFECTGCELCVPPCPVDCIALVPAPWTLLDLAAGERDRAATTARGRSRARITRLAREQHEHAVRMAQRAQAKLASPELASDPAGERKRAIIEAALARARARVAKLAPPD